VEKAQPFLLLFFSMYLLIFIFYSLFFIFLTVVGPGIWLPQRLLCLRRTSYPHLRNRPVKSPRSFVRGLDTCETASEPRGRTSGIEPLSKIDDSPFRRPSSSDADNRLAKKKKKKNKRKKKRISRNYTLASRVAFFINACPAAHLTEYP
jgi:hypothetical protein